MVSLVCRIAVLKSTKCIASHDNYFSSQGLEYIVLLGADTHGTFLPSIEVKLSDPVTIGDQWVELHPQSPLKAEKDSQMIRIDLEPPFKDDFYKEGNGPKKGAGILLPDGDVVNPEIEVIDEYGNRLSLVYAGSRRTFSPGYNLPYPNKWPRDRGYKTVRFRSPKPIKCKTIYWYCQSSKDLK